MERLVTPPRWGTSPTWGPPPPCEQALRTPSYVLIAGLALTDLGTGLISHPIYVTNWLIYALQPRMNVTDKRPMFVISAMAYGSTSFFSSVTVFLMTVMSIERWLHMSRRSLINVRRACFIVVILFLFSIPITAFRVFQKMKQAASPGRDVASGLIVPFFLTTSSIAYFKIFRIIRRHQQQIRAIESPENFAQPAINLTKFKKFVSSIICVLLIFHNGYVPITVSTRISTVLINELVAVSCKCVFCVYVSVCFSKSSSLLMENEEYSK